MSERDLGYLKSKREESHREILKSRKSVFLKFDPLEVNKNLFRLLPSSSGDGLCFHETKIHWSVSKRTQFSAPFKCSMLKYGECPMCEKHDNLLLLGVNPFDAEVSAARSVYLYNVLTTFGSHKILDAKLELHAQIMDIMVKMLEDKSIDISSYQTGRIIKVRVLDGYPKFEASVDENRVWAISEEQSKKIKLKNLDAVYPDCTPDKLRIAMNGVDSINTRWEDLAFGGKQKKRFNSGNGLATVTDIKDAFKTKTNFG